MPTKKQKKYKLNLVFDVRLGTSEANRAYAQSDSLGGSTDSIRTGTKSVSHDCLVFFGRERNEGRACLQCKRPKVDRRMPV